MKIRGRIFSGQNDISHDKKNLKNRGGDIFSPFSQFSHDKKKLKNRGGNIEKRLTEINKNDKINLEKNDYF